MLAFGPVPSRRLGRSLGINNIPPKVCSYACVYCQLGRTIKMQVGRSGFYDPRDVLHVVQVKLSRAKEIGESIDYLTFVPNGEPTLDTNLGREIDLLRRLNIPIAVICNASLIWREDVRADLMKADWVSLKLDSTQESVWRKIDRPHRSLQLQEILHGLLAFSKAYPGRLVTETMLVRDINDGADQVRETAGFLGQLKPEVAYLAVPTRPPAEAFVRAPSEEAITRAYHILDEKVEKVEYLIGYEGDAFALTGKVEEDLLSITAVHPMREEAVIDFFERAGLGWESIEGLLKRGQLVRTDFEGHRFYMRKLPQPSSSASHQSR